MEKLVEQIQALSLDDQECLFSKLCIQPRGWLYAYRIPLHVCQVTIVHCTRGNEHEPDYHYVSNLAGDWCLINMGDTDQKYANKRLNYFSKFKSEIRPAVKLSKPMDNKDNMDLLYCIKADTSWEHVLRKGCFLGGWDVGGYSSREDGYFQSSSEWIAYLMKKAHSIGPTECVVIPTRAFVRIREWVRTHYVYPKTYELVKKVATIVQEETLHLLQTVGSVKPLLKKDGGSKVQLLLARTVKEYKKKQYRMVECEWDMEFYQHHLDNL